MKGIESEEKKNKRIKKEYARKIRKWRCYPAYRLQLESFTPSVSTESMARTTSGEFHSGLCEWSKKCGSKNSYESNNMNTKVNKNTYVNVIVNMNITKNAISLVIWLYDHYIAGQFGL